jgi:triphosphatase
MSRNNRAAGGPADASRAGPEIELKLQGTPEVLESLLEQPAIRARLVGRPAVQRLENIYYDTADQRLRRHGFAFRVRKRGRQYVQTLKSDDAGGLVAYRGEWQTPLGSPEPDLALLPAGALEALNGLVEADELRPVFATRVRRQVRRLETGNGAGRSLVEAALDLGAIEARGQRLPIAELELELLEGPAEGVYLLALQLDAAAPLRVETRSKSLRGYAFAAGEPPPWQKAPPLALARDASVEDAFGTILRACLQHWCVNEAAALDGRDPEGVHQMRVGLRRLRSAIGLFGGLVAPERRAWLDAGPERIIGALGPARDWDVFLEQSLAPVLAARPEDASLVALREAAEGERQRGYEAARAAIGAPDYTRTMLELGHWIEAAGWREQPSRRGAAWFGRPIVDFAHHLLAKRHKKALRLGKDFAALPPAKRHRLRIALKKLRYAAEFFEGLYGRKRTRPYLGALKGLQDALGHLNDVAVAESLTADLIGRAETAPRALALGSGMVLGWLARGQAEVEPRTQAAWQHFVDRKPFWDSRR